MEIEMPKQEHDEYEGHYESRKVPPVVNHLPIERKQHGEEIDKDMPTMVLHATYLKRVSISLFRCKSLADQ